MNRNLNGTLGGNLSQHFDDDLIRRSVRRPQQSGGQRGKVSQGLQSTDKDVMWASFLINTLKSKAKNVTLYL